MLAALTAIALGAALVSVGGCSPLATLNDLLVPNAGYTRVDGIAYGSQPRQRLDVYTPTAHSGRTEEAGAARPVVVFFYGGSWKSGQRGQYRFIGEAFAGKGFVTVVPDYRLYPEVRYPAFVEDGAMAVRWVRDYARDFGGDPDRIILAGHSAGAHTAAMLATDDRFLNDAGVPPESIRAFVGLAGPYAFDPFKYSSTRPVFDTVATPADMQPGTYANGNEPPMLLLHGSDDTTVIPSNSRTFAEQVTAAGGQAQVVEIDGTGHIGLLLTLAYPFREDGGVLDRIARFAWDEAAATPPEVPPATSSSSVKRPAPLPLPRTG
jgi:acetyl esterase/lipase